MGIKTVELTPGEELSCIIAAELFNADKPEEEHLSPNDYFVLRAKGMASSWGYEHKELMLQKALSKYPLINNEQRTQILTILNLSEFANLPVDSQLKLISGMGLPLFLALDENTMNQIFLTLGFGV